MRRRDASSRLRGGSAAASFRLCCAISWRIAALSDARRTSRERANTETEIAPNKAMARSPAARATVLLIHDDAPAWRSLSIEVITVVVIGATVIAIPMPSVRMPGKNVVQ